ncbi:MAG: DNA polymerase III subunit delta [Pseudomonadota bacterium]
MKLSPRDVRAFCTKPDLRHAAILLYGPDPMRVDMVRKDLVAAVLDAGGVEEMRLTRFAAADARKDPAALADATRAQGFFPGQRVVEIDDAADGASKSIAAMLEEWREGDAFVVVSAGQLTPRSSLRKLFEGAHNALAAAIYADPPSRDDVEAALRRAGVRDVAPEAMPDVLSLAHALDPGDFQQTLEKLALYKLEDAGPVTSKDLVDVMPSTIETGLDDVISLVADGAAGALAQSLPKLANQGAQPTAVCIALNRHFRQLHAAATHPQGPGQALARARPPVFGPRRDAMTRQAQDWGSARLEGVLKLILDADLTLRSSSAAPARGIVERLMIRIAMAHPK